ncbi:MAG TPA: Rnf-Nqr domain containing protein [bacterium]
MKQPALIPFSAADTKENPSMCWLLGLCPVLAVTTSTINSIAISAVFFIVLVMTKLAMAVTRKWTDPGAGITVFLLLIISSTLTATADMGTKTFFPDLHISLGIYLSLIAVNCMIISRPNKRTITDALKTGLGYVVIIVIIGIAREVLGKGTLLGDTILGSGFRASPVSFFILPSGAFLVMAFIIAFINSHHGQRKLQEQNRGKT